MEVEIQDNNIMTLMGRHSADIDMFIDSILYNYGRTHLRLDRLWLTWSNGIDAVVASVRV